MARTFKSEGIVLSSLKYSETSLILDIYTEQQGLGSYIVSGVRKQKSRTSNVYHPMNIIDMVAYTSGESLSRIKEASYGYMYQKLDRDVIKAAVGTYIIELVRNAIQDKEADVRLYNFIRQTLVSIDEGTQLLGPLPYQFAIQLSAYLGFQMQNNYSEDRPYFDISVGQFVATLTSDKSVLDDSLSLVIHQLMNGSQILSLSKQDKEFLLDKLMFYFELHIENFKPLRSIPVLRSIFG